MSFFGFGQSAVVEIALDGTDTRALADIKSEDGKKERHYLYYDGESVSGKVNIKLKKAGSKLEHQGIKVELIGQIELYYDRGNHHEFTSLVKELARPGELVQSTTYAFEFLNVEKPYESYTGCNVRLRYLLRVTVVRRITDIVEEKDIIVHTLSSYPEMNNSIKMEVGIEECLHIEFEYNKSKYHLKDVIIGKIYFLLVRIKLKHMEIAIIKRETTGSGPNTFVENDTIVKYEIMDGAPVRGESIPIRLFLSCYDLTPTMKDINKKFSVKYFLNLVLMDEEDRRYFKQQEITLWRKADRGKSSGPGAHVPKNLVSEEGGPKAWDQQVVTSIDTPTRDPTHTFHDLQTESPENPQPPLLLPQGDRNQALPGSRDQPSHGDGDQPPQADSEQITEQEENSDPAHNEAEMDEPLSGRDTRPSPLEEPTSRDASPTPSPHNQPLPPGSQP